MARSTRGSSGDGGAGPGICGRRLRTLMLGCALALFATGVAACTVAPVMEVPDGEPGAPGPCGMRSTTLVNDADHRHPLVLAEPTGSADAPLGGRCDDADRPVVLIAHGYLGNFVEGYQGLVEHLTSQGHVVVFPGYTAEFGPDHQYAVVLEGFLQASGTTDRIDRSRLGVIGHSFGGGMLPWLTQQLDERGWGARAVWAVDFAPWFALRVGAGPIEMPAHMRFTMVSYEDDYFVDARIAIETYASLRIPEAQRQHVMVYSDRSQSPPIEADHLGPVSVELVDGLGTISTDHLDRWVTYRVVDATAGCSIAGVFCDTDLGDVGTRPDGTPVKRAVVRHDQPDVGPPALQECEFFLNQRPCP